MPLGCLCAAATSAPWLCSAWAGCGTRRRAVMATAAAALVVHRPRSACCGTRKSPPVTLQWVMGLLEADVSEDGQHERRGDGEDREHE
jgi:hypothetical protein